MADDEIAGCVVVHCQHRGLHEGVQGQGVQGQEGAVATGEVGKVVGVGQLCLNSPSTQRSEEEEGRGAHQLQEGVVERGLHREGVMVMLEWTGHPQSHPYRTNRSCLSLPLGPALLLVRIGAFHGPTLLRLRHHTQ